MVKREYASRRKKARIAEDVEEDVNNILNDVEVPLNKKSNEIVT